MFEPYIPYNNPYSNPYYNAYNQQSPQIPRQNQPLYKSQSANVLQGKVVDSLDVVKATDIPYDGSVSYFPLTDNSAIVTKQLQQDGTSKMVVYKPITENEEIAPKYVTEDSFKEQIKNINSKDIKSMKEDIKTLKRKLEDIADDIKYKKER